MEVLEYQNPNDRASVIVCNKALYDAEGHPIEPKTKDRAKEKMTALQKELEELRQVNDAKNEKRKTMVEEARQLIEHLQKHKCSLTSKEQTESRQFIAALLKAHVQVARFMNNKKLSTLTPHHQPRLSPTEKSPVENNNEEEEEEIDIEDRETPTSSEKRRRLSEPEEIENL